MAGLGIGGKIGVLWALALFLGAPAFGETTRCETLGDGVEYRAFLPDQNRYVYIAVKIQPGVFPSIFVIADKNYLTSAGSATNTWWLNRSRPLVFSDDKVKIRWERPIGVSTVTGWFGAPDPNEIVQPIRGLTKGPGGFAGKGSHDLNSFAFQTRLEMPGFTGDAFDVTLPSVAYDGVTVTPPVVHVVRDGKAVITQC